MLANSEWIGMSKAPANAPPQKPDPKKLKHTDFAFWLKDSFFDYEPKWTQEDEDRLAGQRNLAAMEARRKYRKEMQDANRTGRDGREGT